MSCSTKEKPRLQSSAGTIQHRPISEPSQALDKKQCRKSFLASANNVFWELTSQFSCIPPASCRTEPVPVTRTAVLPIPKDRSSWLALPTRSVSRINCFRPCVKVCSVPGGWQVATSLPMENIAPHVPDICRSGVAMYGKTSHRHQAADCQNNQPQPNSAHHIASLHEKNAPRLCSLW